MTEPTDAEILLPVVNRLREQGIDIKPPVGNEKISYWLRDALLGIMDAYKERGGRAPLDPIDA